MRAIAFIQARLGSSRLPGKSLRPFMGLPLIDWVLRRLALSRLLDGVLVCLPDGSGDDPLALHCETSGASFFRGPEEDVLRRFALALESTAATHVVRVCADNPFVWGPEIDHLIRHFQSLPEQDRAYAYNHIPLNNRYPDGFGAEMVSAALLRRLDAEASLPAHREHCLSYIRDNREQFIISTFDPPDERLRRPDVKLDIDTADDFARLERLGVTPLAPPEEVIARYDERLRERRAP